MNNYLLSVDPSMKNTGFTLWEKYNEFIPHNIGDNDYIVNNKWKPIFIYSYCFNKRKENSLSITNHIMDIIDKTRIITYADLDLIIERGIHVNYYDKKKEKMVSFGRGKETLDHLRGFIAGQFNKLLTKDMLISSKEWQNCYKNRPCGAYWDIKNEKWTKETSLAIAKIIISENNWNITISNHDEAESLLIGWYYLNKENK